MRFLVGWDEPSEAELISLYLNVDGIEATLADDPEHLLQLAGNGTNWDAILLTTDTPDTALAFDHFKKIRQAAPNSPVVGACKADAVFSVAQFMTNGLRTYIIRDVAGDFMFLLRATLETTVESVRSERERLVSEKLREEIESVRKLQESIIPATLKSPDGYNICARYESSQIRVMGGQPVTLAGGDYYDVFMLDDNSIVLLVGDASGHGMRACMSIMTMHTLVSMIRDRKFEDTSSFVADINRWLCEQSIVQDEGGFITLLYAILRTDTNELQWTSAGHPIPILQHLDDNRVESLGTVDYGGLPLGVLDDAEYETYTSKIPPNSRLLIYTDGLEEAFPDGSDVHGEFGIKGIKETMAATPESKLEDAMQQLFDASNAFTDGSGRHDDTSVVMLDRA
ncbi:MAG: SpoIIE family protein phosphatase [Planctomycetaceae bacterium]|nr:SpoIIE family protein phosphatase [Planctomycetaceae bacterium]MBT6487018.1 SpoIIE family protein phosphatase [Planctomycetaceae bacterium]MBT6494251.1 SpoIIE family protein phosphatase [Planctomycetaceae bacterium]